MPGVHINEFSSATLRVSPHGPAAPLQSGEGTSRVPYSGASTSSPSDTSEYESVSTTHAPGHNNISGRCSFLSKPVHPLATPCYTPERGPRGSVAKTRLDDRTSPAEHHSDSKSIHPQKEPQSVPGFPDFGAAQKEVLRWSSASSVEFTDVSDRLQSESLSIQHNLSALSRCGLCERFLSQRSLWSSRRIVRSGDMPVTSVLACYHVFHAECLDQTTPRSQKNDPPCPICVKSEDENFTDRRPVSRLKGGFPWLKSFADEVPSRSWSCGQVGDCLEGALHNQTRNAMLLLNRNRLKKQLSMKVSASREAPEKLKQNGACVSHVAYVRTSVDQPVECSSTPAGLP